MNRRDFVLDSAKVAGALLLSPVQLSGVTSFIPEKEFPLTKLTDGPKQHWFGYYDKLQVDPTGRFVLGNQVDLFFRSPAIEDKLTVGLIDLEINKLWTPLGETTAWGWQQGCMLQWLPGSSAEVIWNSRVKGKFVSIIHNIRSNSQRILPKPIYTLSPDGRYGFGIDFGRLQFFRPGYGYATEDKNVPEKAPEDTGIYRIDLKSGASELILSYADLAKLDRPLGSVAENYHWINHLLVNPAGDRMVFLNRSRPYPSPEEFRKETGRDLQGDDLYVTRAITVNTDGSELYALNDSGQFSHFIWDGNEALCAWAEPEDNNQKAFYLFQDKSKKYKIVGEESMTLNGHNTYVPHTNNEWILNDTYPQGKERLQELYLYHIPTKRKVVLGHFYEPKEFSGEWRCDLHPRCNPSGTKVFFDSTHENGLRQIFEIDISSLKS